jgi:ABC-type xylose transport system substrate-binding protein
LGELWYDTQQGVPYWQQFLGQNPTNSQIASAFNAAALTVPAAATANTIITSIAGREVSGQVQFSTSDGTSTTVNF